MAEEDKAMTNKNEEVPETFDDLIKSLIVDEEEDVEEVSGDTVEHVATPKEEAGTKQNDAKTQKYVCSICGREFDSLQGYAAHMRWHKYAEEKKMKEAKKLSDAGEDIDEDSTEGGVDWYLPDTGDEPLIRSPKEELERWFIEQLANRLPMAIGKKRTTIVIETLKEDPDIIWDPHLLKMHIMQLAPTNVNKYLLDWILRVLYKQLEAKKKNIEESYGFMIGSISPPEENRYMMTSINPPRDSFTGFGIGRSNKISPPRWSEDRDFTDDLFDEYEYRRRPRRRFYDEDDFDIPPRPLYKPSGENETTKAILDLLAKLIDEIKSIKESKPSEGLVEVPAPDGSGVIKAPPSMIPFILQMYKEKSKERDHEEPYVELPNPFGEGFIRVPASLAPKYMELLFGKKEEKIHEEPMVDVPNPFGPGTLKVPVSLAPVYIELAKLQREKEKDSGEPMVEIPNPSGTGTMKVPASLAPVYMSLLELTKAVKEVKEKKPEEKKVKVFTEDGKVVEMSPEEAVFYMQLKAEKERQKQLEQTIKTLQSQIERMYSVLHPENVAKLLDELGYTKQGSPTLALLNSARQDMNKIMDRLFGLAEMQMKNQMVFVTPPVGPTPPFQPPAPPSQPMTPKEREEKIKKLKKSIDLAQQIASIEKEIKSISQPTTQANEQSQGKEEASKQSSEEQTEERESKGRII